MAGPGPIDGTIETSNFGQSNGNNVVLNSLLLLLAAASGTDEGHWISFFPFKGGTLEVVTTGSPTFSLQLYGSNSPTKPSDATNVSPLGSAITTAGLSQITSGPRWIKANLTAISGGGTVNATLNAFSP